MKKQQKYKRNHWVPKSYLRMFAADVEKEKIWLLGKTDGMPKRKPIAKVAVKFHLYAPAKDGVRDYTVEKKLSGVEQLFGSQLWLDASTGYVDLSDEVTRKAIALLTAIMYLRNPIQLEQTKNIHQQLRDFYMQFDGAIDSIELGHQNYKIDNSAWPEYRDAGENEIKSMWLETLQNASWLAEILLKMRWVIVLSDEPVFITSDNPVTILHPSLHFRGLKEPETSVLFPLSPTRALWLDNRHSEPNFQYYKSPANGAAQNMLVWRNAIENMFSHRHPYDVCEEMVAQADAL